MNGFFVSPPPSRHLRLSHSPVSPFLAENLHTRFSNRSERKVYPLFFWSFLVQNMDTTPHNI